MNSSPGKCTVNYSSIGFTAPPSVSLFLHQFYYSSIGFIQTYVPVICVRRLPRHLTPLNVSFQSRGRSIHSPVTIKLDALLTLPSAIVEQESA